MLLILELILFGTGIYLAIAGKATAWIAGKGYIAEGGQIRLAGVILALPLPLAFCAELVLGIIDPDLIGFATVIEILMVIGSAIISTIIVRKVRIPEGSTPLDASINIEPK